MLIRILKRDFLTKKTVTIILFMFVMISAFLASSSFGMGTRLAGSLHHFLVESSTPHFVQLHTGEINAALIDQWSSRNSLVKASQIVEIVNVDGLHIYFGNSKISEESSVMSFDFVAQNKEFDFLLNLNDEVIHPKPGQIAVPVYFMQGSGLKLGDKVKIVTSAYSKEFTVSAFVRDALMNPSIIHSKRFVIHPADFADLKDRVAQLGLLQYLIEFQLFDSNDIGEFANEYQLSSLPKMGPAIDFHLIRILNSVTDGIVIGILILVSLLLTLVALLCLRFTLLAAIEEDYRQIGVMKALGIPSSYVRNLYLTKYIVLAAFASVMGYVASLCLSRLFEANMRLYLGAAPENGWQRLPSLLAATLIFSIVVCFCVWVVRRFHKISAVEALRASVVGDQQAFKKLFSIGNNKFFNLNVLLGLRDVLQRFKVYFLLFFVFFICAFIAIVPLNFLTTIQSPSFINYMGVGRSDMRIDLHQGNGSIKNFDKIISYLENDQDIKKYEAYTTSRFKITNNHNVPENINMETGNFSTFPIHYLKGEAPTNQQQIALSYLKSQQLGKKVGDHVNVFVDGQLKEATVCGIYQDITNGGLTAKALYPSDPATVLWQTINVDLQPGANVPRKVREYTRLLFPARVTDIHVYLTQTLGDLIEKIKMITMLATGISIVVSALIAALFLKMILAKDCRQIAILKAIGFSNNQLRMQYLIRTLSVLSAGIVLASLSSNTLGQTLVSLLWSSMGAPEIKFIIDPLAVYVFLPVVLGVLVAITTFLSMAPIGKVKIAETIVE